MRLHSKKNNSLLTPFYTKRVLRSLNSVPVAYQVNPKEFIGSSGIEKKESEAYLALKDTYEYLQRDSIAAFTSGNTRRRTEVNVAEITQLFIADYLDSTSPYFEDETQLIKAQQLAKAHDYDILTYASEDFIPDELIFYQELKSEPEEFKQYLEGVIEDLALYVDDFLAANQSNTINSKNAIVEKLRNVRTKLENTPQYITITTKADKKVRQGFVQGKRVPKINLISGNFVTKGQYYVMAENHGYFKRNELVQTKKLKEADIPLSRTQAGYTYTLIQNTDSKELYCVSKDFPDLFAYKSARMANGGTVIADVYKESPLPPKKQSTTTTKRNNVANTSVGTGQKPNSTTTNRSTKRSGVKIGEENFYRVKGQIVMDDIYKDHNRMLKAYNDAITKSKEYTALLVSHRVASENGRMTAERLAKWRTDLVKAENLQREIANISGNPKNNNAKFRGDVDRDANYNYANFKKALAASKRSLAIELKS